MRPVARFHRLLSARRDDPKEGRRIITVQTEERLSTDGQSSNVNQTAWTRLLNKIGGGRTPAALFDQGLVSAANFLTNILLARAFGVRDYGVFALAWIAVLFANSLQYALIVTPMMSVGPKQEPDERPAYYGSVLVHHSLICYKTTYGVISSVPARASAH